ncbi:hypothetical protein ZWY2020_010792 [Hordeum vulgare]|nr:hypothetical protein ZWY2020_010792 [Hordeum vulgare]
MARRPRPAPPAGPRRRAARRRAGPRRLPRHRHLRVGACGRNASSRHLPPLCVPLGTGGDGTDTVNISTGSTILAAAAGAKVTKQGSRASSSACGSADVLEVLGVNIELEPEPNLTKNEK